MQLINISDIEDDLYEAPKIALGIDFGTTNSLVSVMRDGEVLVIPDASGKQMIPSIISYDGDTIKVGNEVVESDKISSVKRLLGKGFDQVKSFAKFTFIDSADHNFRLELNGKVLAPVEVAAHILNYLRKIAEDYLGQYVNSAVITVPAYFDDVERAAIKDAAKIVGLNVLRLINEPTAAALAYGLQRGRSDNEICLVYDLGGGTFDVSILRLNSGVFQVLSTDGDILLGGDDFDEVIADFIRNDIKNPAVPLKDLLLTAKRIKEQLSFSRSVTETLEFDGEDYTITLTVEEFNKMLEPYIERTMNIVRSAIRSADVGLDDIKSVVLVGGSTRILAIRKCLKDMFGEDKVLTGVDPDQAVVYGAALQAHSLTSADENTVLIDVLPLSLGTEVMGGLMDVIIERNTPVPVSRSRDFTTFCDGQTVMRINVCQGEREMVKHNKSLACFELSGITPLPAAKAKIQVSFTVDVDGLLTVEAFEKGNDSTKEMIQVNSSYGLEKDQIDEILANSFENVESDFVQRNLVESKIKANSVINAIEKYIVLKDSNINQSESEHLRGLIKELRFAMKNNSIEEIQSMTEGLEEYFHPLVTDNINKNLVERLLGKPINNYKSDDD